MYNIHQHTIYIFKNNFQKERKQSIYERWECSVREEREMNKK